MAMKPRKMKNGTTTGAKKTGMMRGGMAKKTAMMRGGMAKKPVAMMRGGTTKKAK
jgi:hypothetical protein